jgi:hypothetical protein
LIRLTNNTCVIPAEAGIQGRSKGVIIGFGRIPGQARNDEIHGIFSPDN